MKNWRAKFGHAFRGIAIGFRESSFLVHIPAAVVVFSIAWRLECDAAEWCLLVICIGIVWGAELFNTAIEYLAQSITRDQNKKIRDALDVAAGAVLVASCTAVLIGAIIFVRRLAT